MDCEHFENSKEAEKVNNSKKQKKKNIFLVRPFWLPLFLLFLSMFIAYIHPVYGAGD
jgi:hypothetical protein